MRRSRHRAARVPRPRVQAGDPARRAVGQSLVEFALLLPLMLAFVGVSLDLARVYQVWITLEAATRDAAELVATKTSNSSDAETEARRVVCVQSRALPGFAPGNGSPTQRIEQCAAPVVSLLSFEVSTTAPGATPRNPVGSATVRSTLPFRPLLAYPILTQNGVWNVGSTMAFSVVQGR